MNYSESIKNVKEAAAQKNAKNKSEAEKRKAEFISKMQEIEDFMSKVAKPELQQAKQALKEKGFDSDFEEEALSYEKKLKLYFRSGKSYCEFLVDAHLNPNGISEIELLIDCERLCFLVPLTQEKLSEHIMQFISQCLLKA